jgi:hypothetical protein
MQSSTLERLAPLTGVVFVVLFVAAAILIGEGVDPEDGVEEVLDYYDDNEGAIFAGSALGGLAGVFLIFFGGVVRRVLRDAEGPGHSLSAVAFGGALALAVAIGIGASLSIALAESFDDIDPVAVEALNALGWNYYVPFALGMATFMLASGISIVRHGALPGWFGWIAVAIGILSVTPVGFFAFLAGVLWILIASVLLYQQGGRETPAAPAPSASPRAPGA